MSVGKRFPGFCIVVAALAILLFVYSKAFLLAVLAVLLLAAILSACLLRTDARRLRLEMTLGGGRVGDDIPLVIRPRLHGTVLVAAGVIAELEAENKLFGTVEHFDMMIPLQGKKSLFETSIPANNCGETHLKCKRVKITDPFGLFTAECTPCEECCTVIYPKKARISLFVSNELVGKADTEEMIQNRRGNDPSEMFEIREYIPGDDVRSIHWKLSSKTDTLIVRQASDPIHYDMAVMPDLWLDESGKTPTVTELNCAVATCVAICKELLSQGMGFCVVFPVVYGGLEVLEIKNERDLEESLTQWLGVRLQSQESSGLQSFVSEHLEKYFTKLLHVSAGMFTADTKGLENRIGVCMVSISENTKKPVYTRMGTCGGSIQLPAQTEESVRIIC